MGVTLGHGIWRLPTERENWLLFCLPKRLFRRIIIAEKTGGQQDPGKLT